MVFFWLKHLQNPGKKPYYVEINPNDERGNLMKRRGLFLKNCLELEKFIYIMNNEKLKDVLRALENLSGSSEDKKIETIDI